MANDLNDACQADKFLNEMISNQNSYEFQKFPHKNIPLQYVHTLKS